jgi:hypothetical protein
MLLELWAKISMQHVVYLMDFDGEITKTVARKTPLGLVAKRYWPSNIRRVLLRPGGRVYKGSYIERWGSDDVSKLFPAAEKSENSATNSDK